MEEKQTLPDVGNSFADWQAQSRPDRAPATNQNEYTSRIEQTIPPMSIPDIMRMVLKRQAEGKVKTTSLYVGLGKLENDSLKEAKNAQKSRFKTKKCHFLASFKISFSSLHYLNYK